MSYQYLLTVIDNGTHQNRSIIKCVLPSYLDNNELINFTDEDISVSLINQTTNCNYISNRRSLNDIVSSLIVENYDPFNVVECRYNKTNYPGVVIDYQVPDKTVKIIVFSTGKINITSANTNEQVHHPYEFIKTLCRDCLDKLLLESAYENKQQEYEKLLPDQNYVGCFNGNNYYLLRKNNILFNPLRPNSDLSQTSHCNIKGLSVSDVMRIENMITQVQFYRYFNSFSPLLL